MSERAGSGSERLKYLIWDRLVDAPDKCPVNGCHTKIIGASRADWDEHWNEECNPLGALYEPGPEVTDG